MKFRETTHRVLMATVGTAYNAIYDFVNNNRILSIWMLNSFNYESAYIRRRRRVNQADIDDEAAANRYVYYTTDKVGYVNHTPNYESIL